MLGITGLVIGEFGYLLVLSKSIHAPYWTVLVFGAIAGLTGYISMVTLFSLE